jgi:hypothetical protein
VEVHHDGLQAAPHGDQVREWVLSANTSTCYLSDTVARPLPLAPDARAQAPRSAPAASLLW